MIAQAPFGLNAGETAGYVLKRRPRGVRVGGEPRARTRGRGSRGRTRTVRRGSPAADRDGGRAEFRGGGSRAGTARVGARVQRQVFGVIFAVIVFS